MTWGLLIRQPTATVSLKQLCSSGIAVIMLMLVIAGVFRFATGQSPWPVFIVVELPSAAVAFALLTLTAPR